MIFGVGVDTVSIARFARALERAPALTRRLFTAAELADVGAATKPAATSTAATVPAAPPNPEPSTHSKQTLASLAARFAAKEALVKAITPLEFTWQQTWIERQTTGKPRIHVTAALKKQLQQAGINTLHLSLSHDAGIATAFVIAETTGADKK